MQYPKAERDRVVHAIRVTLGDAAAESYLAHLKEPIDEARARAGLATLEPVGRVHVFEAPRRHDLGHLAALLPRRTNGQPRGPFVRPRVASIASRCEIVDREL
jgi:hypothetical protein